VPIAAAPPGRTEGGPFLGALDRQWSNLAVARRELRIITTRFHLAEPSAAPRPLVEQAPRPASPHSCTRPGRHSPC
jgi:hypothetical protein